MKKRVLITGASGFAGNHLTAAALVSDSEAFVAVSPGSTIQRTSGITRVSKHEHNVVNAGSAKNLALSTISIDATGDNPVANPATKPIEILFSNVTNRRDQTSDGNIYGHSVLAEGVNKQMTKRRNYLN